MEVMKVTGGRKSDKIGKISIDFFHCPLGIMIRCDAVVIIRYASIV
jgi:hypothetical protein